MHFAGRPPELFSGISRADAPMPVAYPASCSPQAWSSASVLLLLRAQLDLRPADGGAVVAVHRADLSGLTDLRIEGLRGGGRRHHIDVREGAATVTTT